MTDPRWPVIEVFGPTVQGEGPEAGAPCYFVRFGGCDFRCTWCDSMYAVEPAQVRVNSQRLGTTEIVNLLNGLDGNPEWVILSGGNPALHELGPLVAALQELGYRVAVETQGTKWKPWLAEVDRLVVSPKPPSSGMVTPEHSATFKAFMAHVAAAHKLFDTALKIVVADDADLAWAKRIFGMFVVESQHLSVCTPQDNPHNLDEYEYEPWLHGEIRDRYRWLCEQVAADPDLRRVRVLPQLHVIAWGDARGV